MNVTADELEQRLDDALDLDHGKDQVEALRSLAADCAASGDEDMEYLVKAHLIEAGMFGNDSDASITAYAWCVAKHDSDPERFDLHPGYSTDLLWAGKWVVAKLSDNPAVPRDVVEQAIDDLAQRYVRAGEDGRQVVEHLRMQILPDFGRVDEVHEAYVKSAALPRSENSDCRTCVSGSQGTALALAGHAEDGIRVIVREAKRNRACAEDPQEASAMVLLDALELGNEQDIRLLERFARTHSDYSDRHADVYAPLAAFYAVTRNADEAMARLTRVVPWLGADAFELTQTLRVMLSIAIACGALTEQGYGDRSVPLPSTFQAKTGVALEGTSTTVSALGDALWPAADSLASRFDARNGNAHFASRVAKARGRAHAGEQFDLKLSKRRKRR